MKLTDKCEQDFFEYLGKNLKLKFSDRLRFLNEMENIDSFITPAMQYGVLVDYFDSVGLHIEIKTTNPFENYFYRIEQYNDDFRMFTDKDKPTKIRKTRQEVREQAIIKANEIYNKQ